MSYCYQDYIHIFKALSDETRLKIVDMLSCGELCACKILEAFHFTQPTLSYHMKLLTVSGLVNGRREGAWMHYSLNMERIAAFEQFFSVLTAPKEDCICKQCSQDVKQNHQATCKEVV